MNRKTTGIIAILACFLAGAAAGICGHSLWLKYKIRNQERPIPYVLGDHEDEMLVQRMERELHLTEDQKNKFRQISKDSRKAFKDFFDKNRPIMEGLVEDFENQISGMLTEDQKIRYFEFKRRQREMMRMPQPMRPDQHKDPFRDAQRKKQFEAERAKILDHFFIDFDKDQDGFISLEEAPSFLEHRFELIDEDNDQKLSKEEVTRSVERTMIHQFMDRDRFTPDGFHPQNDQHHPPFPDKNGPTPPQGDFE
jgi:hypothetical protein